EDGIRDPLVTGVQTCALPICVPDIDALESHPKLGASWESFAIEQVLLQARAREAYYWRTQAGTELDLLLFLGGKRIGVEVKYGEIGRASCREGMKRWVRVEYV